MSSCSNSAAELMAERFFADDAARSRGNLQKADSFKIKS